MYSFAISLKVLIPATICIFLSHTEGGFGQKRQQEPPPSMIYHNLVYHDQLGKILLFGGQSKHGWKSDINDVWMLDIEDYSWSRICLNEAISDSGYAAHSPVYDQESNQIVHFNQVGETQGDHRRVE